MKVDNKFLYFEVKLSANQKNIKFMKKAFLLLVLSIAFLNLGAQTSKQKNNPVGKWDFEAPAAPQGYNNGVVEVTMDQNKLSASMSFEGTDYKIPAETVKFERDTLNVNVNVSGTDVTIKVKFDEADKMSGVASTYDGDIPLTLTREKKK